MSYLIVIAATFALFGGFLIFVSFEMGRGKRAFRASRTKLDRRVNQFSYIVRHIDWPGFVSHVFKVVFERAAHDAVHFTLVAVRSAERTLTKSIQTLRERVATRSSNELPAEGSPLLRTLVRFHKSKKPVAKEDK